MVKGGGTGARQLEDLLAPADERGTLTGQVFVEILDTGEIPLSNYAMNTGGTE